jgi:uncharacterized protein (TIGR02145 family)
MKKYALSLCVIVLFTIVGLAQVTITFTGRDGGNHHLPLTYVSVTNATKGWQEYLFWPDTVLTLQSETGIHDVGTVNALSLQMLPNPFQGITDVTLSVAEEGMVHLEIADMNGHRIGANDYSFLPGVHRFRITLARAGTYVMTARQNGKTSTVKLVCTGGGKSNTTEYVGITKTVEHLVPPTKSHTRGLVTRPFDLGDQMEYVGYAIINNNEEESQHLELPLADAQTYVLPFSATQVGLPVVITANVTNITDNSADCGGEVTDDGGDSTTVRGVCIDILPNPSLADRHTVDGTGMGTFTSQLTGLSSNITYYVRAYATNHLGTVFGDKRSFTIPINPNGDAWSCPGTPTVTDVDGNIYNTVQIGQQCWMRENLRTKRYFDGTLILAGEGPSTTTGYWYYPMNNGEYEATYGLLYNWPAVMHGASGSNANPSGVQGICPDGWHVPSDAECTQLLNYVNSQSQNVCGGIDGQIGRSLAATVGWDFSGLDTCTVGNSKLFANNATGFGALPAGFYSVASVLTVGSEFGGLGYVTFFWTSTGTYNSYGNYDIYYWGLHSNYESVFHNNFVDTDGEGQSVRCVKN